MIYLKITTEHNIKVLWLCFRCKDKSSALINLNELAETKKGSIIKQIMLKSIKEYLSKN
jgi:hypothetical protein